MFLLFLFCFFWGDGQVKHIYSNIQGQLTYCSYDKLTTKNDIVSKKGHQKFPPENVIKKLNQIGKLSTVFHPCFHTNEQQICTCIPMFQTNEKLSLMVVWSSSVSISCFKVQSSIGHLVFFFDSENSLVSEWNSWCPYDQYNQIIEEEKS